MGRVAAGQRVDSLRSLGDPRAHPVDTLLDQVAQYPTYVEAYYAALEQLAL
jgi:hypothetical protein